MAKKTGPKPKPKRELARTRTITASESEWQWVKEMAREQKTSAANFVRAMIQRAMARDQV